MSQDEVTALQKELEATKGELQAVKSEREVLAGEVATKEARVTELEQALVAKGTEVASLEQKVAVREGELGLMSKDLALAVSSYRTLMVQANPGLVEELVTGETIEEVNQSVEKAKSLINQLRKNMEAETARSRVPAGAPPRALPDLSALSSREKIQYAIGGKR